MLIIETGKHENHSLELMSLLQHRLALGSSVLLNWFVGNDGRRHFGDHLNLL